MKEWSDGPEDVTEEPQDPVRVGEENVAAAVELGSEAAVDVLDDRDH